MRIPTIEIRRPDGRLVKINESDRFVYAKMGCDMDPHKQRHTSGGEPVQEPELVQEQEPIQEQEKSANTFVRKTVKLPTPEVQATQTTVDDCIAKQDGLNDLIVS